MFFNNFFYIASHEAAMNFLIWALSLFIVFDLFYLSTLFFSVLMLESSAIHWVTCFRVSNCYCFFWMLWTLGTVRKLLHPPHASRITISESTFTERLFSVSKEWIRSWSHTFLITYDKTLTNRLLAVRLEKETRRKKIKKLE